MSGTQFTPLLRLALPPFDSVPWDVALNTNFSILDGAVGKFTSTANFVGVWKNATAFIVSQVVFDSTDSSEWSCLVAHTSAAAPTTFAQDRAAHSTFWKAVPSSSDAAAAAAQASANAAAASANTALTSATTASNSLKAFQQTYYGAFATDPVQDPTGGARTEGDLYFNTTTHRMRVFVATPAPGGWIEITVSAGSITEAPLNTTTIYGRANGAWAPTLFASKVNTNQLLTSNIAIGSAALLAQLPVPPTGMQGSGFVWTDTLEAFNIGYNFVLVPGSNPQQFNYIVSGNTAYRMHLAGGIVAGNVTAFGLSFDLGIGTPFTAGVNAQLAPAMQLQNVGNMKIFGSFADKIGGGTWGASSDIRIKNVVGDYTVGLTELTEMVPKLFTYKGNDNLIAEDGSMGPPANRDTTTQFIGLIGQDCEPYMPELVTQYSGYIDGVLQNDIRRVETTAVIMALVNAVKTLNDMNTALEARVAALEAA